MASLTLADIEAMTDDQLQRLMVCAAITNEAEWNVFLKAVAEGRILSIPVTSMDD